MKLIINSKDQTAELVDENGAPVSSFTISTSKSGLGEEEGSYCTPRGKFKVSEKIGNQAAIGTVFKLSLIHI